MADAILSFAVEKLGNFLIEEIGLPERVENDIEWLKTEFVFMQAFLKDVDGQQNLDNRAEALESEVKAIAKDAVDILDKFAKERSKGRCIRICGCIGRKEGSLYGISEKISSLKGRVEEIKSRRERWSINNNITDQGTSSNLKATKSVIKRLRRATSYLEADELFVGFQDVLNTLMDELLKDDSRRSIVSIYGMGGLGKTTLAKQLYHADMLIQEFENRAWLSVSQEYNTLDLLKATYKSFKKKDRENLRTKDDKDKEDLEKLGSMDEKDMETLLRDHLKDKKYLVVFDDVWDKEAWASIKRAFPDNKRGSRIIITTRNKDVAERIDHRTYAHNLRYLTTQESWELFCKKISFKEGNTNWCSPYMLDNFGKSMVDKCRGLPLAITTLGGLLLHKKRVEEWIKVKNDLWRNLENDSIEIKWILSLSYDDLSKELKKCFLYLGLFPEDYLIDSERLMWLWMGEDFFPQCDRNEDDRADEILEELIGRSLIQVAECYKGLVISCKIHDLVRELAMDKCNEVNFLNIYNPDKEKYRIFPRYAIHAHGEKFISLQFSHSKIQTLVMFNQEVRSDIVSKVSLFKGLEVLDLEDLEDFNALELPDSIGDIVHLRYLGLPEARSLPPSIGNLLSLQILRAFSNYKCTFPREISNLKNLRHLYARPNYPFMFHTLTSLRTLRYIHHSQFVENDVASLHNLRELAIEGMIIRSSKNDTLSKIGQLTNLQILSLRYEETINITFEPLSLCQNLLKLKLEGFVENVACLEKLPPSITMLTLTLRGHNNEDPMPILGRLPNLKTLSLNAVLDHVKEIKCEEDGSFPQLEFLYIFSGEELESFQLGEGSMPVIRGLDIKQCPYLTLPERLRSIPPPRDFLTKSSFLFFDARPYLS